MGTGPPGTSAAAVADGKVEKVVSQMSGGIVYGMWLKCMRMIFPVELVTVPVLLLDVGKLYHAVVQQTVERFQRLGYIPRTPADDVTYACEIWDATAGRIVVTGADIQTRGEFLKYVRAVFVQAFDDTVVHLRSYPTTVDVVKDVLPTMWDECQAYISRAAVVAEGAPMPATGLQ
jgi:hypothetical protein